MTTCYSALFISYVAYVNVYGIVNDLVAYVS